MQVDPTAANYGLMIATLLAISLAGERIVVIVKTMFPTWFAEPAATPGTPPLSIKQDQGRRLRVQAVAFGSCWLAAASLNNFDWFGQSDLSGLSLATPLVGLLAMGGSAFWTQVLGISSALKDLKTTQANNARTDSADKAPPTPQKPESAPAERKQIPAVEISKAGVEG